MVILREEIFGSFEDELVKKYTWETRNKLKVSVISYGATIQSIMAPGNNGERKDVALGFDDMAGYINNKENIGATIGRCANRIANGRFKIDGKEYRVGKSQGNHHLHGGFVGFDRRNWKSYIEGTKVVFSYLSKDGEENYPGDLVTNVTYEVTEDNEIVITHNARTTKATVVNMTNHSYFNLAGHDSGSQGLFEHHVKINADRITEIDAESIPTGNLPPVKDTFFDLLKPVHLGTAMAGGKAYEHNYCLFNKSPGEITLAAEAFHPPSGRFMEVFTDQPGVQFYTSNTMPALHETPLTGKSGVAYRKNGSFCFETQNYPDAINHSHFPNAILTPGSEYVHTVKYKFSVRS